MKHTTSTAGDSVDTIGNKQLLHGRIGRLRAKDRVNIDTVREDWQPSLCENPWEQEEGNTECWLGCGRDSPKLNKSNLPNGLVAPERVNTQQTCLIKSPHCV